MWFTHKNPFYPHEHGLHTVTWFRYMSTVGTQKQCTGKDMVFECRGVGLSWRFFSKAGLFYMPKIELNGNTQAFT